MYSKLLVGTGVVATTTLLLEQNEQGVDCSCLGLWPETLQRHLSLFLSLFPPGSSPPKQ